MFSSCKVLKKWQPFFQKLNPKLTVKTSILVSLCVSIVQWVWHSTAHISERERNPVQLLMSVMGINNRRQACGS